MHVSTTSVYYVACLYITGFYKFLKNMQALLIATLSSYTHFVAKTAAFIIINKTELYSASS